MIEHGLGHVGKLCAPPTRFTRNSTLSFFSNLTRAWQVSRSDAAILFCGGTNFVRG